MFLESINLYSKVASYNINTQKFMGLHYLNNEREEIDIQKQSHCFLNQAHQNRLN